MVTFAAGVHLLVFLSLLPTSVIGVQKHDSVQEKITKKKHDSVHEKVTKEKYDSVHEKGTKEKFDSVHEKVTKEKYERVNDGLAQEKYEKKEGRTTKVTKEGAIEQNADKTDLGKVNRAGVIHYKRSTFKKRA